MFHIENILETDSKIKAFQILSDHTLAYSSDLYGIKILDAKTHRRTLNIKIKNKEHSPIPFCFSPNKKRLVYVVDKYIYVLDTLIRKDDNRVRSVDIINKIAIDYEVTTLAFDPSSTYFFIGTQANQLIQYRHNSSQIINTLVLFKKFKKRTKGISAIDFLDSRMIVSGNRGDLVNVDIFSNISHNILVDEGVTINHLLYLNENHILSSHSNGDLRIIDVNKMNVYDNIDTIFTCIYQTILLTDKRYALVCGDSNYISLINLEDKKAATPRYITFDEDVKQMALLSEHLLIVLLSNNTIVKVNLPTNSQLASLIIHNSLDEAYDLVKKDVLLLHSQEYKNLEQQYDELVKRAIDDLPEQNKDFAKQTLSLFEDVTCKKDEIECIFKAFDNYKKFQNLFFEKEYSLAYNLVYRYPALKNTPEYLRMEYIFKKTLDKAQICLVQGKWAEADSLLRTYKFATSKKAMIKLFLNHGTNFLKYLDILKSKDIQRLKEVSQRDEIFAQYLIYFGIKFDEETSIDTTMIDKYLDNGEVDKAEKLLAEFEKEEQNVNYEVYRMKCEHTKTLYTLHTNHDFKACYELIDKYDFLLFSKLGKSFTKYWKNLILHAEIDALNGEIDKVETKFSKLEGLLLRETKIENLIKFSYQIKIDKTIESEDLDSAHELISKYATKFSEDEYITRKIKLFEVNQESRFPNIFSKINMLRDKS